MDLRLGRLPGKIPVGLRDITYYSAGPLPQAPADVAVPLVAAQSDGTPWGMDGNDQYGDCGVAGLVHLMMAAASAAAKAETFPPASDIVAYYLKYTQGQDCGVVLSDFLSYARAQGFLGHAVAAYAPVSVRDVPSLHFAIWAYAGAYTGITVTAAMQQAFADGRPWDMGVVNSQPVGGHCVPVVGYDSDFLYAVTWGRLQPIAYSAWHYLADEAWAVIPGELASGDGRGLNLQALQADLGRLA